MAAEADEAVKAATSALAAQAHRFEGLNNLGEDVERKLKLIKLSVTIPAPRDPALGAELSQIAASLQSDYGRAKWCPNGASGECLSLNDMENILATSRDPRQLLALWEGWHALARPMRARYERMVELANQGARETGFADVGAMWRSNYDMPPEAFAAEVDRLWQQVRPLYESLHAYMRWKLAATYGPSIVREDAPIPGASAGQHVGTELGQCVSTRRSEERRPGLRPHRNPQDAQHRSGGHGAVRRAILPVSRVRAAPANILGALDVYASARPRGGLPRQRLGHRLPRRPAHQDVHRAHRRGFLHDPPRAGAQFLPACLRPSHPALPQQRERRLPRSHRRHHRPFRHAGIPESDRIARIRAAARRGYRPVAHPRSR